MLVTPETPEQASALRRVLASAEICSHSCDPASCVGMKWVWDDRAKTAVRRPCSKASAAAKLQMARSLIDESGIPPATIPIACKWLTGLTVVCPDWKATTVDHELSLRRTTAGIVAGWIIDHQKPAYYLPYYMVPGYWRDHVQAWKRCSLLAFVGWHFRGLSEEHSSAFNDILFDRIDRKLPTVICCSADPSFLTPRWRIDTPAVHAIQHPDYFVRVKL
jgi:hypothetical protein